MAKPDDSTRHKEARALVWAVYRASLPYILVFIGAMLLVTWLITEVFL